MDMFKFKLGRFVCFEKPAVSLRGRRGRSIRAVWELMNFFGVVNQIMLWVRFRTALHYPADDYNRIEWRKGR